MEIYLKHIGNSSLLSCLPNQKIMGFLRDGSFVVKNYGKNNIIHLEGDTCMKAEILLSGKVRIDRIDPYGNFFNVSELSRGDILGSNLLFSSHPHYPMTVTAKEATLILEIHREIIIELCYQYKNFLIGFLEAISNNAFHLGRTIHQNVHRTIRQRLILYLKHEAKKQRSTHIVLGLSKKKLAEKFGVQRTSLSRELKKMKDEGLIDYDTRSIKVLDDSIWQ